MYWRDNTPTEEACMSCRFWMGTVEAVGECRRYPPLPIAKGKEFDSISAYPSSGAGDWCGEYQKSKTKQE